MVYNSYNGENRETYNCGVFLADLYSYRSHFFYTRTLLVSGKAGGGYQTHDGEAAVLPRIDPAFSMDMKLSDAIQAGAGLLKTNGPNFQLRDGLVAVDGISQCNDALTAAQVGLLGRRPTIHEHCRFYWNNPWKITPGEDLEMWLRMTAIHGYRWADVIAKLRRYGA